MYYGFYLASSSEFAAYVAALRTDRLEAARLFQETFARPAVPRSDWSCSLALCIGDDYQTWRLQLPDDARNSLDRLLSGTLFSGLREGRRIADLACTGLEFSGVLSPQTCGELAALFRQLPLEEIGTRYATNRGIEWSLVLHVLMSWNSVLETASRGKKYLVINPG